MYGLEKEIHLDLYWNDVCLFAYVQTCKINIFIFSCIRERVSNTTQTEFNIQHLKPDTSYEVRVRAYNKHGPSQREATIVVTTDHEGIHGVYGCGQWAEVCIKASVYKYPSV